ncbi:hypothetical protein SAMN05444377_10730 [Flavobacterium fontis]|uniref:Glutaminyl-tRNA synthetase n=1 Tax=Flavobacterium fontis TaxID=1124188 RepID=A0A1M5AXF2_9FLAO|nr:DUF6370 family protein [Flavobacterium fontis]SHF34890.1 hypothetical protein SAMN05444377_10730 [Flavobacterium fontis]
MKTILFTFCLFIISFAAQAQEPKAQPKTQRVEVSCGQCQFGMKDKKGCDLAVRIDGQSYFVEGTKLDDHGDAHAEDGFCSAIRQAEVIGEIKGNRFVVTYFKLLPLKK